MAKNDPFSGWDQFKSDDSQTVRSSKEPRGNRGGGAEVPVPLVGAAGSIGDSGATDAAAPVPRVEVG
jgi:hypothetical protein